MLHVGIYSGLRDRCGDTPNHRSGSTHLAVGFFIALLCDLHRVEDPIAQGFLPETPGQTVFLN